MTFFRKLRLKIALFLIKSNFNIIISQSEDGMVIFCYCCNTHLKESCLEVGNSPNPIQLTLDENGKNREFDLLGMK